MAFHSGASEGIQKGGTEGVGTHKGKDTKGLSATLFKGAFDSSKTAMMESFKSGDVKGGIKIFAENLKDTASSLLKTGLSTVLKDILGSIGGGGGIGGLLGFAGGGEPPVGRASLVGERGPELFVPRTAGTIIPNHALGGGLTFAGDVHINASTEEGGRAAARGLFDELPELVRRLRRGEYPELQRAMAS